MPEYGLGSLQNFVPNTVPFALADGKVSETDLWYIAILDLLIWNNDRHAKNILVSDGRAFAIDNSQSFWLWPNIYMGGLGIPMLGDDEYSVAIQQVQSYAPKKLSDLAIAVIGRELKSIKMADASILSFLLATEV